MTRDTAGQEVMSGTSYERNTEGKLSVAQSFKFNRNEKQTTVNIIFHFCIYLNEK